MYNRRYEKIFIMLRQEQGGFGVGQRAPWGSCILELKNNKGYLHIQVQGLRKLSSEEYAVYLLGGINKKQRKFHCGMLSVEENGRANLEWEFSPKEMEVDGFVLEDLHTVAILLDNKEPICVPMCGYIREKTDWKNAFLQKEKAPSVVIKPQEKPIVEPQEITVTRQEEPSIHAAETPVIQMGNPNYHGDFKSLLEKFKSELRELQDAGIFTTKEMEQIERAGRNNTSEFVADAEVVLEEKVGIPDVIAEVPVELPVEVPEVRYLDLEEVIQLEGIPLSWRNEFFFLLAMKKHRGFLWYEEEGLLGVSATMADEDMAKFFGFTYFWQPEDKEFGYWMMEMNP